MLNNGQPPLRFHLPDQVDELGEQFINTALNEFRQALGGAAVLQQAAAVERRLFDLLHRRLQLALVMRDRAVVPPRERLSDEQRGQRIGEFLVRLVFHLHDLQQARGRARPPHPLHEALGKTA